MMQPSYVEVVDGGYHYYYRDSLTNEENTPADPYPLKNLVVYISGGRFEFNRSIAIQKIVFFISLGGKYTIDANGQSVLAEYPLTPTNVSVLADFPEMSNIELPLAIDRDNVIGLDVGVKNSIRANAVSLKIGMPNYYSSGSYTSFNKNVDLFYQITLKIYT